MQLSLVCNNTWTFAPYWFSKSYNANTSSLPIPHHSFFSSEYFKLLNFCVLPQFNEASDSVLALWLNGHYQSFYAVLPLLKDVLPLQRDITANFLLLTVIFGHFYLPWIFSIMCLYRFKHLAFLTSFSLLCNHEGNKIRDKI